ncbi:hypothetical protein AXG93_2090s1020 [Marchantia polymorpha subsp. ruderalis]|uniref:F-box domain-containing protein n=1 Tax=Marchantia polymorpha subsp. ruderalis TaxID=1480154 RepID=A0A176WBB9_MARPO|nr:hypothetical protein AXG93_2090s1020 [Marchantia polymorpha subsp. ruderalis]
MEPERDQHQPEDAWESLPIDFLIKILRDHDLPISTLLECRLVRKKWKEVIDGPELRNRIWKNSVIVFHETTHGENTAHFCYRDRWITSKLTFGDNELVATDGGLLCFGDRLDNTFVMYNPVLDEILLLDVPLEIDGKYTVDTIFSTYYILDYKVAGLVVDQYTKNFKLVLGGLRLGGPQFGALQDATDRRRTLIYDSTTGTWSWGIHPFPERIKDTRTRERSVVCNGCLYWFVWDSYLLIFDLEEGTWNTLVEESKETPRIHLQMAAYERHVCLLGRNWSPLEGEFELRSDVANFLRSPIVRRMDGALIRRVRNVYDRALIRRPWNEEWDERMDEAMDEAVAEAMDEAAIRRFIDQWHLPYPKVFNFYATGGRDAYFVLDNEYTHEPPFHSRNRVQYFVYAPSPDDPCCAIIPSPRGSAGLGWTRQQRREEEETREALSHDKVAMVEDGNPFFEVDNISIVSN